MDERTPAKSKSASWRQTIRLLELDIRAGVDVQPPELSSGNLTAREPRTRWRVRLDHRKRGIVERAQATAGAADPDPLRATHRDGRQAAAGPSPLSSILGRELTWAHYAVVAVNAINIRALVRTRRI